MASDTPSVAPVPALTGAEPPGRRVGPLGGPPKYPGPGWVRSPGRPIPATHAAGSTIKSLCV